MKIKLKKQNSDGIARVESEGKIKEIVINEDFLHPNRASIAICFRGKSSSGILELTPQEIEIINERIVPKLHLLKGVKVMKFRK